MIDREKLMTALTQCAELMCIKSDEPCVYYEECDWEGGQHSMACENAIAALREDADEIESLKDTVYNLRLYLTALSKGGAFANAIFEIMMEKFDGMPGFVEVEE